MSIDLAQFIPSFLEESFEGLELMESSLLNFEQDDSETINAIFRAAHSIKGGAGTFGFEHVTKFTHLVETLLDEVRDGRRRIEQEDIELLLESVDCMRLMMEAVRDEGNYDQLKVDVTSKLLLVALNTNENVADDLNNSTESNTVHNALINRWHIEFIPEHHLVQTGNDPILLFDALAELGLLQVEANCGSLPPINNLDPEELFFSWILLLDTSVNEEQIREVFEWIEDECQLNIYQEKHDNSLPLIEEQVSPQIALDKPIDIHLTVEPNDKTSLKGSPTLDSDEKSPKNKSSTKTKVDVGSIRVGVDKVDGLINLVGELVIIQSMLSELGNDFDTSKIERLTLGLDQLLQNTKELQESVMRIRMLPISFAFNRFPRLVYDLANKTGKKVELIIKGEQTELDKTVMEQIGDPLVHLVRNAVDHGIETSDVRLAHGKSENGTITLNAYHQGGNIVIEINDDGAGIDRQAVLAKAIEKGIIGSEAMLTDSQVFDLIFEPGFSTAKEVSDISGRGVGMDVVKKNIHSLGGRIQVDSFPSKGSTFKVNLPLTLAILDGQLVKVGSETYIIPLITIVESLQTQKELINRVSGDMVLFRLREDNIPVLPIYQLFNINSENENVEDALLVVVEADGQKVGLMVDDLLAQQQVVIKSLADNYKQVSGVSGATILGDGSVALILDIPGVINMAMVQSLRRQKEEKIASVEELC